MEIKHGPLGQGKLGLFTVLSPSVTLFNLFLCNSLDYLINLLGYTYCIYVRHIFRFLLLQNTAKSLYEM